MTLPEGRSFAQCAVFTVYYNFLKISMYNRTKQHTEKKRQVEQLKAAMESTKEANKGATRTSFSPGNMGIEGMANVFGQAGLVEATASQAMGRTTTFLPNYNKLMETFENASVAQQVQMLKNWIAALEGVEDKSRATELTIQKMKDLLPELEEKQKNIAKATNEYTDALSELYAMSGQISSFNTFLDEIGKTYNIEGPRNLIKDIEDLEEIKIFFNFFFLIIAFIKIITYN